MKREWMFALLALPVLAASAAAQPAKPSLTVSPANPGGLDDVVLEGSAAEVGLATAVFQLAADAAFEMLYLEFTNTPDGIPEGGSMTSYTVGNDRFPLDTPLYARAQYYDADGAPSEWSEGVEIRMAPPAGLKAVHTFDFEDVPVDSVPEGWDVFNTTTDTGPQGGYYHPELMQWVVKDVEFLNTLLYYPSYGDPLVVETELKIADGNTLIADSGNYVDAQNFYETHIITEEFDLSNVTNVHVSFNSNYVQNQDNIAILEYTLDGGTVNVEDGSGLTALPVGTWYPVMYYLDVNDIVYDESGAMNVPETLAGTDDKGFPWFEYMFADDTAGEDEAAAHILPRLDDHLIGEGGINGEYDSKRWERFRLEGLDNQPSVKFRFAYQGSWSWFWSIDNFQIWGDDGTPVREWSLY